MPSKLFFDSSIVAAKDQVSSNLADEAVILGLKKGVYYGLNPTGAFIWEQLKKPISYGALRRKVLEEFEVDPQQCEEDLLSILAQLRDENLIEVKD